LKWGRKWINKNLIFWCFAEQGWNGASMCLSTFVLVILSFFWWDWLKRKLVVTTLRNYGNLVIKWKFVWEDSMTWLFVVCVLYTSHGGVDHHVIKFWGYSGLLNCFTPKLWNLFCFALSFLVSSVNLQC
jgi:hypothetical protein